MGLGIIECKGPYVEGAIVLPDGMTIIATQLHWKWDSNDYRLKVEHPDIPDRKPWETLPRVFFPRVTIFYRQDEQDNEIIDGWDVWEYT